MEQNTTPPVNPSNAKGFGIAGMVIGIIAIITSFIPCFFWWAITLGVMGLVLSAIGLGQAKKANLSRGMAIAGLICSVIAIVIVVVWGMLFAKGLFMAAEEIQKSGVLKQLDSISLDSLNKALQRPGALDSLGRELKQITDSLDQHIQNSH